MKNNNLKCALLLAAMFASGNAAADNSYGLSGNGTYTLYQDVGSAGLLATTTDITQLPSILGGEAPVPPGPGGNVRLSTGSTAETLTTTFTNGYVLTLSSLTSANWGTPGSGGLLDQFSTDIINTYAPGTNLANFEAAFIAHGYETTFGNPNISYANLGANGVVSIGLAGYIDLGPVLGPLYTGDQVSKIVNASFEGHTAFLYSMGPATPSGVYFPQTPPLPDAFTGNYQVTIPEPSGLALMLVGLTGFLSLRRKAVKS